MATTDRPRRCPTHRRHQAGCTPCRRWSAWEKRTRNGNRRTNYTNVQHHIRQLTATGMTYTAIARRAGTSRRHLPHIAAGKPAYILADTADAILGVTAQPQPRYIDATGTRRRLQALAVQAHSSATIAAHLGVCKRRLATIRLSTQITPAMAARVTALYDRLSMTVGGSPHATTSARQLGWVGPLAWDDDTIDNPSSQPKLGARADDQPDPVVVQRIVAGERAALTGVARPDRAEAARVLVARGLPTTAVAKRLHVSFTNARKLAGQVAA